MNTATDDINRQIHEQMMECLNEMGDTSGLFLAIERERAKAEILEYMMRCIREEVGGVSDEDALDRWNEYKKKHNIDICIEV